MSTPRDISASTASFEDQLREQFRADATARRADEAREGALLYVPSRVQRTQTTVYRSLRAEARAIR
jgi:hypothetical protein